MLRFLKDKNIAFILIFKGEVIILMYKKLFKNLSQKEGAD